MFLLLGEQVKNSGVGTENPWEVLTQPVALSYQVNRVLMQLNVQTSAFSHSNKDIISRHQVSRLFPTQSPELKIVSVYLCFLNH